MTRVEAETIVNAATEVRHALERYRTACLACDGLDVTSSTEAAWDAITGHAFVGSGALIHARASGILEASRQKQEG